MTAGLKNVILSVTEAFVYLNCKEVSLLDNTEFLNRLYLENRIKLALFIKSIIYSKNYDDAEDCLQETFLIVIKKSHTEDISNHPNIKGWLFTIAKNVSLKFNSAYMKDKANLTDPECLEYVAGEQDFTEQLIEDIIYEETDKEKLLDNITSELTQSERKIFELRQKNLKNQEIAKALNKSESTVKSTYSRLKPKVEAEIKKIFED